MNKSILTRSASALLFCMALAGCSHDIDVVEREAQQAIDHAQETLGFYIPENQDWVTTSMVTANLPVVGESGLYYKVSIYTNNPVRDKVGYTPLSQTLTAGQTLTGEFRLPAHLTSVWVGMTDQFGRTSYKHAAVVDDQITSYVTESDARTRSQASPSVPTINQPYDAAWVAGYLTTAKEPTSDNINHNYDNGTTFGWSNYIYNGIDNDADYAWFEEYCSNAVYQNWGYYGDHFGLTDTSWDKVLAWLYPQIVARGHESWMTNVNIDQNYVTNYKITGTWSGAIGVAASEGYLSDHVTRSNAERTIVVTGKWNITEDQRIGEFGKIIIADGGEVNVSSGKTLNMVNQARLVVLPGGKLTGEGRVEVNNGNAEGLENYNGGTIDVGTFNNNFGKFYNYGTFKANEYHGGAQESNFYNRHLAVIDHFGGSGSTANARIFNNCQFYVKHNARIRNYEGVQGSALIVDGELMFSSSEDGTSTPSYVGLADGALVKCGTLYNNGTSWSGPTSGHAVLDIEQQITYLNWQQDAPETGGYFENNIYVYAGTWTNVPDGNGYHQTDPSDVDNYKVSIADYKFFKTVANCRGNGGVQKVSKSNDSKDELIPADSDFDLGKDGCTPGFKGTPDDDDDDDDEVENTKPIWSYAFEDSNLKSDYDMNDVVIQVQESEDGTQLYVTLMAAGCQYDNEVYLNRQVITWQNGTTEVHDALYAGKGLMVNTGGSVTCDPSKTTIAIAKPSGYDPQTAQWSIVPSGGDSAGQHIDIAGEGESPCGIVIPAAWKWPRERKNICVAYPDFATWGSNPDRAIRKSISNWYENPVHQFVYNR